MHTVGLFADHIRRREIGCCLHRRCRIHRGKNDRSKGRRRIHLGRKFFMKSLDFNEQAYGN